MEAGILAVAFVSIVAVAAMSALQRRGRMATAGMTTAMDRLSCSFGVLSQVCAAHHRETDQRRNIVLVIDDSEFDSHMIGGICETVLRDHDLVMTFATSIASSYRFIPSSRVIVLDVVMDGTSIRDLNGLIEFVNGRCPVIIHATNEYPPETFPGAFRVVQKWSSGSALVDAVESAMEICDLSEAVGV